MKFLIQITFVMLVALGISGCSDPQFGRSHNDDRIQRNLPIIANNWITGNVRATETMWKLPEWNSNSGRAAHTGKKVAYQDGKRTWEEDYYYSGRRFDGSIIDPDSETASERITVHYDYTTLKEPWRCYVVSDRHGGLSKISLQEAERILETWGLSRLNYKSEQGSGGNG